MYEMHFCLTTRNTCSLLASSAERTGHKKNPEMCVQTLSQLNSSLEQVLLFYNFLTRCSPALALSECVSFV